MARLRYLDKARVKHLMSTDVVTLTQGQSVPLAESMMDLRRVRHLPVVDGAGKLVGLVTHRDLLAAKAKVMASLTEAERSEEELSVPVASIMQRDVWTVTPNCMANKAANMLRDHRYGCLPVVQEGRLVGILTEADFVEAVVLVESDEDLPPPTVADAMTESPFTINLPATIGDARAMMNEHGIRHLPLSSNGELVGIVSARDLRIADGIAGGADDVALSLIGSEEPHVVDAETPLHVVLNSMADERRGSAMVTQDGELVGILTTTDAVRYLAEWLRAQFPQKS